jgi:predicted site-specific integrase-resolvase
MQNNRASVTGDKCISGTPSAKQLGIGASTLSRWVKAGKLPKPEKTVAGMLLFHRAATDRLAR